MKIRYSDGFEIEYEIGENCGACMVQADSPADCGEFHRSRLLRTGRGAGADYGEGPSRGDTYLYVTVRDNGKGMTEEEIRRLLSNETAGNEDYVSIG